MPRRLFAEEFKKEAIELVTEQYFNAAQAGRQLDIDPKSIRLWIAQSERGKLTGILGAAKLTADQQRIRGLERGLAATKIERDILKIRRRLRKGSEVRYAMIDQLRHVPPVYKLCCLLGVARSGYQV